MYSMQCVGISMSSTVLNITDANHIVHESEQAN
jgi:hypothetical protein